LAIKDTFRTIGQARPLFPFFPVFDQDLLQGKTDTSARFSSKSSCPPFSLPPPFSFFAWRQPRGATIKKKSHHRWDLSLFPLFFFPFSFFAAWCSTRTGPTSAGDGPAAPFLCLSPFLPFFSVPRGFRNPDSGHTVDQGWLFPPSPFLFFCRFTPFEPQVLARRRSKLLFPFFPPSHRRAHRGSSPGSEAAGGKACSRRYNFSFFPLPLRAAGADAGVRECPPPPSFFRRRRACNSR